MSGRSTVPGLVHLACSLDGTVLGASRYAVSVKGERLLLLTWQLSRHYWDTVYKGRDTKYTRKAAGLPAHCCASQT